MRFRTALLLVFLALPRPASADTVVLAAVADTSLFSIVPDNNLGAVTSLPIGGINTAGHEGRALLRFDLVGAIPTNATINSVTLHLWVAKEAPGSGSQTIDLHRLSVPWTEGARGGDKSGDAAVAGESSWNDRSKGSAKWAQPGGKAGTDFVGTASGSFALDDPGEYDVESQPGLVADVAAWLADPSANFGWMLREHPPVAAGLAKRISSRESGADGPQLTVGFTMPVSLAPPVFGSVKVVDNALEIRFHADAGFLYELQSRDDLGSGEWTALRTFAVKFVPLDAVVSEPLDLPGRFYRLAITGTID